MTGIPFNHEFEFRYGIIEPVADGIRRIVARNPGPFTGPGTGTYIIGRGEVAVIDPGPMLPDHVDALLAGLGKESVSHILVTHTHADHSPAARLLRQRTGAPVFAFGPHARDSAGELEGGVDREFKPDFLLDDGEVIPGDGWSLEVVHTPGHCSNHICFAWPGTGALFCGDHIMAWSTPVIIPPDGSVGTTSKALTACPSGRKGCSTRPTEPRSPVREISLQGSGNTGCAGWNRRLPPSPTAWIPCPPCAAGSMRTFPGISRPGRNFPCLHPFSIFKRAGESSRPAAANTGGMCPPEPNDILKISRTGLGACLQHRNNHGL